MGRLFPGGIGRRYACVVILLALLIAAAAGYQVVALLACAAHLRRREAAPQTYPPVSILKPIYGADPAFDRAIRSHALLDYPNLEILFGVESLEEAAAEHVRALQREFPHVDIKLLHCPSDTPNAKVGRLEQLGRAARHGLWVVNDADIVVPRDYLPRVTAPLEDARVGLVTCLYRAAADSLPGRFEALGISTDFAPSALVAPFVGVKEFGLGSTLAFRAADLRRAGGFEALGEYLADDYQMGKRISSLGLRVHMSRTPVETHIGAATWREVWGHQVRWARTVRVSRGLYFGLPVTHATMWAIAAALVAWWPAAAGMLALRLGVAFAAGWMILRDKLVLTYWPLIPLRDLFEFAVWIAGAAGTDVQWRGLRIRLDAEGRITERRP